MLKNFLYEYRKLGKKWQYEIYQENNPYCCTSIHIISVKCCNIKVLIEINIY